MICSQYQKVSTRWLCSGLSWLISQIDTPVESARTPNKETIKATKAAHAPEDSVASSSVSDASYDSRIVGQADVIESFLATAKSCSSEKDAG